MSAQEDKTATTTTKGDVDPSETLRTNDKGKGKAIDVPDGDMGDNQEEEESSEDEGDEVFVNFIKQIWFLLTLSTLQNNAGGMLLFYQLSMQPIIVD
jgi:hypothetical protein